MKMKIKRGVMRKFIKMLRSGENEQEKGALRLGSGYCATGLLCELYRRETGTGKWTKSYSGLYQFNGHIGFAPQTVSTWAGFDQRLMGMIVWRNDQGKSFVEIANWLERKLEKMKRKGGKK
jgi:hypothetical protein